MSGQSIQKKKNGHECVKLTAKKKCIWDKVIMEEVENFANNLKRKFLKIERSF